MVSQRSLNVLPLNLRERLGLVAPVGRRPRPKLGHLLQQRAQPRVLARQPRLLRRARDRRGQMSHIYRLGEKVLGAQLHRLHRDLRVVLRGQYNHRRPHVAQAF